MKEKLSYLIDERINDEATKLLGLKKYLKEFSKMDTKESMEVKLWKEYLMFAQLFGIADEVARQFKKLYPEIITEMVNNNYDINDFVLLNNFSNDSISYINSSRATSSFSGSYSSGGGGGGSH